MVTWAVLLLTSAVAAAAAAPGHRIVGGEETSIERYPSIVQLDYLRPLTGWGQSCAGTIVTPTVVVSAAHCTNNVAVNTRRIRVGATNRNSGGTLVSLRSYRNHPSTACARATTPTSACCTWRRSWRSAPPRSPRPSTRRARSCRTARRSCTPAGAPSGLTVPRRRCCWT
ncbi:unnamed protein product [Plutella xylostella]|uniref:(diamondback moth) hypothetical protein n=1 Tax=Plutella xylostella TaxID=51655 RepID=A0A8S4GFY3_PLUXY|nr:unnamed protein product [Plutella xylostella]